MDDVAETSSHTPTMGRVLLVDDEPDQVALLRAMLTPVGLEVLTAESAEQGLAAVRRSPVDVVVTDINLPGASGIDLIRELRNSESMPAVVVMTGQGSVASAVEALKLGASDYLQKPIDPVRLTSLLRELLRSDDVREAGDDEHLPSRPLVFEGMVGGSPKMRDVFARIERVAPTGAPVLIVGESGTGKELVARALHNRSRRANGPFVPIHTGAIPKELVASELFGHEKGAFTGALTSSEGKFEAATGGTVFLDEVGTMDISTQISLLRVLETYRYTRVGANKERDADVRIIAATNRDLLDLVEANQFREDLYYRLNVFTIAIPPLRERPEDVIPISERFLRFYAKRYNTPARCLSDMAVERLLSHTWPGNVRELRNVMEQTAVFARREVVHTEEIQFVSTRLPGPRGSRSSQLDLRTAEPGIPRVPASQPPPREREPAPLTDMPPPRPESESVEPVSVPSSDAAAAIPPAPALPTAIAPATVPAGAAAAAPSPALDDHPLVLRIPVGTPLAEAERLLILKTLEVSEGNKQRAARILGISRRGLYTKLAAYGEHVPAEEAAEVNAGPAEPPVV
jgi:DNA-binding NtrC family response regulator